MAKKRCTENEMKDFHGKWRTYSLFREYKQENYKAYWSIRGEGSKAFPLLKNIYMSYDHVPGYEYDFAMEVLGSWEHWDKLSQSGLKQHIQAWRDELDVKRKAKAMKAVIDASVNGQGAQQLQAAKYLADKGYSELRGRPSKEEKARISKIDSLVNDEIEGDLERVGLKIVNKG